MINLKNPTELCYFAFFALFLAKTFCLIDLAWVWILSPLWMPHVVIAVLWIIGVIAFYFAKVWRGL